MIEFCDCTKCKECPLCDAAKNPGLPTRPLQVNGKSKAILFIGEAPGFNEDTEHVSWIGYSGQLLEKFIEAGKLADYADIYLSNACRCWPGQNNNPTKGQITKCRKWLKEDLSKLAEVYQDVIIMCCGASAVKAATSFKSIKEATKYQGTIVDTLVEGKDITVFNTYHPAALHPKRSPSLVHAVQAHFNLLKRFVTGEMIPNKLTVEPEYGLEELPDNPEIVSMDIETYGILEGVQQTVFIPEKSVHIDKIAKEKLIVSVAFAWEDGGRIRTAYYRWDVPQHRRMVVEWFKKLALEWDSILIGANIKFDLQYLRYCDKTLHFYINPCRLCKADDVLLAAFLFYDEAPERGLKELAMLYGITNYSGLEVTAKSGNATSSKDKSLAIYNCMDTAATLMLYKHLWRLITEKYGDKSAKLGNLCKLMRNTIIWCTALLEEAGSAINLQRLKAFHDELYIKMTNLRDAVWEQETVLVAGTGSEKSLREFVIKALKEAGCLNDKRVRRTDKKKDISINEENWNLLLNELPEDSRTRDSIEWIKEYNASSKLYNTYTNNLMNKPRKGIVTRDSVIGMVYPSWYPIPSYNEGGGASEDKDGGQRQGRFSARNPGRQTEPSQITACYTSRFYRGLLVGYDLSQIELRMAALLSGEPLLLEAFAKGEDPHTQTALMLFPEANPKTPGWKESSERALGKTINFLVLYRGGAVRMQMTAREQLGLELSTELCQKYIDTWYEKHYVFKAWQDRLIEVAGRQGYIELPTGWSRTYGLGKDAAKNVEQEICNHPVQTLSSQLLQTAQFAVVEQLHYHNTRSKLCHQVYDSLVLDVYPKEIELVDSIVHTALSNPPLLKILAEALSRTIPIKYDRKIYDTRY